jgi:hypothetical protein
MRVKSVIVALGVFASAVWAPAALAERGADRAQRGDGAQRGGGAAPPAQGGQQAPTRGGGRGPAGPPAGPAPRLANGKPDLTGLWNNPYTSDMAAGRGGSGVFDPKTREPLKFARQGESLPDARPRATGGTMPRTFDLPFTDWGLKEWKEYDPVKNGDYAGSCLPFGLSRSINSPHGVQVVHTTDMLAFLFEQNTWHHWVPLRDDFKWPEDLPESWNGTSKGHWDGDTLVMETSNFNGYTKLDTAGHPHSKQLKMTNTFRRLDSNTMEHTVTVHDPKAYTQDWMNIRTWRIKPAPDVLMEYSCEENNLENLFTGAITPWKRPENVD